MRGFRGVAILWLGVAPALPRAGEDVRAGPTVAAAAAAPAAGEAAGLWRGARWGMTVDELLAAVPGAARLEPPLKLADGNEVAAGLEPQEVAGHRLAVRFVFEGGRLALVSLRTPQTTDAPWSVYEELQRHLEGRLGKPDYAATEKPFVEQRQTRWTRAQGIVDLKAVPGTVVLMYSAPPAAAR